MTAQPTQVERKNRRRKRVQGFYRTKNETMTDRLLVLVRHGESEWNLKNPFTGWHERDLSEKGVK